MIRLVTPAGYSVNLAWHGDAVEVALCNGAGYDVVGTGSTMAAECLDVLLTRRGGPSRHPNNS